MDASVSVLMYHAIGESDGTLESADAHYTVSMSSFKRHVELVAAIGARIDSVAAILAEPATPDRVAFTFDDGHVSNAVAAEVLLKAGGRADLFVNPTTVGHRGFLSWTDLRDLAQAGISIQSHGNTHRYFDELDEQQIHDELAVSKSEIEARIGKPVVLFAPPGGRLPRVCTRVAAGLGYLGICCSAPGVWHPNAPAWPIPRLAVLESTSDAQIGGWMRRDSLGIARLRLRSGILGGAKRVLGNRRYESMRAQALRLFKGAAAP